MCIKFIQQFFSNNKITIDNNLLYYKIIQDIHNCKTLSNEQILFINTLSNDKLIEIIQIYNIDISKFNTLIY